MRGGALAIALLLAACTPKHAPWSDAERAQIASLWIGTLGPPPADPSNAHADDPAAAALGQALFFDARLSANGRIACASCHKPELAFTDGRATSAGLHALHRNAPSLAGAAWSPWLFWDGRADSLWAQATGPLTHADEMGMTASRVASVVAADYAAPYEKIFGAPPPREPRAALTGVAKALAAYVRTLRPPATRFDAFARALRDRDPAVDALLSAREQAGLHLFLGKAQCLRCHNGPLLTNHGFHNTGLARLPGEPLDLGRAQGVQLALASEYNCRGAFNDARGHRCPSLDFARAGTADLVGAFKVPSLRGVALTAPYMHDGRFATLRDVLDHYNRAPQVEAAQGHSELLPLGLTGAELEALEAFLLTLGPAPLARGDGAE